MYLISSLQLQPEQSSRPQHEVDLHSFRQYRRQQGFTVCEAALQTGFQSIRFKPPHRFFLKKPVRWKEDLLLVIVLGVNSSPLVEFFRFISVNHRVDFSHCACVKSINILSYSFVRTHLQMHLLLSDASLLITAWLWYGMLCNDCALLKTQGLQITANCLTKNTNGDR